jgi:hypothetical protein
MIQLEEEEFSRLLWAAIHDDRRVSDREKWITRYWDHFSLEWKNRFNGRNSIADLDQGAAIVRRK